MKKASYLLLLFLIGCSASDESSPSNSASTAAITSKATIDYTLDDHRHTYQLKSSTTVRANDCGDDDTDYRLMTTIDQSQDYAAISTSRDNLLYDRSNWVWLTGNSSCETKKVYDTQPSVCFNLTAGERFPDPGSKSSYPDMFASCSNKCFDSSGLYINYSDDAGYTIPRITDAERTACMKCELQAAPLGCSYNIKDYILKKL